MPMGKMLSPNFLPLGVEQVTSKSWCSNLASISYAISAAALISPTETACNQIMGRLVLRWVSPIRSDK